MEQELIPLALSIEIVVIHSKVSNFKLLNTISQVDVANIV